MAQSNEEHRHNRCNVSPDNGDDTQTSIYLIYNHSLHTIRITGSAAIPEFPTAIISILIITGTVTIIMMRNARGFLKKHQADLNSSLN